MNTLRFFVIIFVFSFYSCGADYISFPSNEASSSNIEPAGIPAPVAKSIKPISSTNIVGTSSEFALEMGLADVPEEESLMVLGEAGSVDSEYQIQISNKEGEVLGQFTPNEDGSFVASISHTLADFNETLLVKVVDTNDNQSTPIFVTIHSPNNFLNYSPYTVHVTQLTNVPSQNIDITSVGDIIFNGVDSDNKPIIYSMPLQGGTPEPLAQGFSSSLSGIQVSVDGKFVVGFDDKAGHLFRVDLNGNVTQLTPYATNSRHFKLSPDGKFVAQEVQIGNGDVFLTLLSTQPDSYKPRGLRLEVPDLKMNQTKSLQVNWAGPHQLVVIRESKLPYNAHGDRFRIELIDLTDYDLEEYLDPISPMTILTIKPTLLAEAPFVFANIQFNPTDDKVFTFECGNETGQMEICLKDFSPGYEHLVTRQTLGFDLGEVQLMNSQWNASGELILYEVVILKKEYPEPLIGTYHLATATADLLGFGSQLKADPFYPELVSYLSYDEDDQLQVGVINLALHPLTKDLF